MTDTLKSLTKHVRGRIRHEGIKARVRMSLAGCKSIQVDVPEFGLEFTPEQQRKIRIIAQVNRLTWARGLPIDIEQMTNPAHFEFWADAALAHAATA